MHIQNQSGSNNIQVGGNVEIVQLATTPILASNVLSSKTEYYKHNMCIYHITNLDIAKYYEVDVHTIDEVFNGVRNEFSVFFERYDTYEEIEEVILDIFDKKLLTVFDSLKLNLDLSRIEKIKKKIFESNNFFRQDYDPYDLRNLDNLRACLDNERVYDRLIEKLVAYCYLIMKDKSYLEVFDFAIKKISNSKLSSELFSKELCDKPKAIKARALLFKQIADSR